MFLLKQKGRSPYPWSVCWSFTQKSIRIIYRLFTSHDPSLKCSFPDSYEMLLRSTRAFYDQFVQELLNKEYRGVCNLLKDTHETAVDFYAESMDRNIEYIDRMAGGLEKA